MSNEKSLKLPVWQQVVGGLLLAAVVIFLIQLWPDEEKKPAVPEPVAVVPAALPKVNDGLASDQASVLAEVSQNIAKFIEGMIASGAITKIDGRILNATVKAGADSVAMTVLYKSDRPESVRIRGEQFGHDFIDQLIDMFKAETGLSGMPIRLVVYTAMPTKTDGISRMLGRSVYRPGNPVIRYMEQDDLVSR